MIFSDLPSPAKAGNGNAVGLHGFAQAGNRSPVRIESGAGFFRIMRYFETVCTTLETGRLATVGSFKSLATASSYSGKVW